MNLVKTDHCHFPSLLLVKFKFIGFLAVVITDSHSVPYWSPRDRESVHNIVFIEFKVINFVLKVPKLWNFVFLQPPFVIFRLQVTQLPRAKHNVKLAKLKSSNNSQHPDWLFTQFPKSL